MNNLLILTSMLFKCVIKCHNFSIHLLFQATLRKIADTCGTDILSVQDSQELVEPKLLDSFLAYSSQNESYV